MLGSKKSNWKSIYNHYIADWPVLELANILLLVVIVKFLHCLEISMSL